jgi:pyrroloquinoline-quinone synthase
MGTLADDVETFVADLQAEIRARRLSLVDADFLRAVEAGSITREQIGEWASVFYAATRNGRALLGNFYANSPDDPELRRELAENLYEEETGRLSGVGRCHMDVFADFLSAFDLTPDQISERPTPFGEFRPFGRAIPPDEFYVELAAYGFSVESPNAEFCERICRALKENYDFSDEQLTWFSMHAALDADHGAEFRKYVERATACPGALERLRSMTLDQCEGTKLVWDGGGAWRALQAS